MHCMLRGSEVLCVHLVVGEQSQIFKDVRAQVVGLVDDEDGTAAGFCAKTRDLGSHLAIKAGA